MSLSKKIIVYIISYYKLYMPGLCVEVPTVWETGRTTYMERFKL